MNLLKPTILTLTLTTLSFFSFAQDFKKNPGYRFSKEDMHEFLLAKSKSQRGKAIGALVLGPVLTGVGVYLANKNPFTISGSGNYMSVRESNTTVIGKIIGTTGIITTLSSIPFFISASKNKKKAMLVLSDQSTSYLNKDIAVPGVGLSITL